MIRSAGKIPELLHDSVALRKLGFYTRFKEHDAIPELLHDSVALRKLGFYTRFKEHDKMRLYNN
jgi:hypothetical protein